TKKTEKVAQRLSGLLQKRGCQTDIVLADAYNAEATFQEIQNCLSEQSQRLVGNFTGGTKPMVLALLRAARDWPSGSQLCYFRTERSQGVLYLYDPETFSLLGEPYRVHSHITLDDYLTAYLGEYRVEGPSKSRGGSFEKAVAEAIEPYVDELRVGVKKSGALDIDLVFRCGNQIGIAEVKTGGKARKKEGIDQLNTAGARDFLGIYVKKFLIVDASWEELTNLRELAEAYDIAVVELISFGKTGTISESDREKLVSALRLRLLCGG
ncbi:hypothetical protein DRN39_08425, partial [Thermococci archaeon]